MAMATQSVPLLQCDDYPVWVKAMKRHLKGAGLYDLINTERKKPRPPMVPQGATIISTDDDNPKCNDPAYLNYCAILTTYEDYEALEESKSLWDALANVYEDQAAKRDPMAGPTALFETKRASFNSHAEYESSLQANVAICKAAGTAMDDKPLATIVRNGLPDDPHWGTFRSEMMDIIEKGDRGLAKILQSMEICDKYMPASKATAATDAALYTKVDESKAPQGERTKGSGPTCWNCGKTGNIGRFCDKKRETEPSRNEGMSEAKVVVGIDHLLIASEYKPLPDTMKATNMMTDQHRLRVGPVFLDRDDVLTGKFMTMVHNAYDDLCELSEGKCWSADVRNAKLERFVVAPVVAAFTTAMARQQAEFAEQTAAVTRQDARLAEKQAVFGDAGYERMRNGENDAYAKQKDTFTKRILRCDRQRKERLAVCEGQKHRRAPSAEGGEMESTGIGERVRYETRKIASFAAEGSGFNSERKQLNDPFTEIGKLERACFAEVKGQERISSGKVKEVENTARFPEEEAAFGGKDSGLMDRTAVFEDTVDEGRMGSDAGTPLQTTEIVVSMKRV
ncbi:hypothetical protein FN846DRAFT_914691 [Sphaerosporella brunnea]|uniref:Uncharacterized protein n=1 Tax=Sphaerosporella brunnea TaxID=1250544 RepID=A0A5J5ECD3_9PEZI|nr:hypothetical protein FN846DRAFT_914691 [Sphaerosporella brunnea]